jgi:NAD(P)-dependent dehydrogenase (short-subunit alcohol dehydrogenase family)
LAAAVKEIQNNVAGAQEDVSNLDDLDRLFCANQAGKGEQDIVLAKCRRREICPFGEITDEFYDSIFDINVKGLLFTVQKALALSADDASIILNASIVASKGLSSNSVCSAAVRSFARTWTTELQHRRIRENAPSPGSIDTPGLSDLLASSKAGEQRRKMITSIVPLARFGTPDEIAKAARVSRVGRQQRHRGNGVVRGRRFFASPADWVPTTDLFLLRGRMTGCSSTLVGRPRKGRLRPVLGSSFISA